MSYSQREPTMLDYHALLIRLRGERDRSPTLREMAEICVEIEEAMGGRRPTRGFLEQSINAPKDRVR